MKTKEEMKKLRTLRITNSVWKDFTELKNRDDKSWDLFLKELISSIKHLKEL